MPTRRPRSLIAELPAAIALMLATAACAADDEAPTPDGAQPTPETTTFVPPESDVDVPLLPGMVPVGDPAVSDGGVTSQSYRLESRDAATVLASFEEQLAGTWSLVTAPTEPVEGTVGGQWARDGHHLLVTATDAPTLDDATASIEVQIDIVVYPPDVDPPPFPPTDEVGTGE